MTLTPSIIEQHHRDRRRVAWVCADGLASSYVPLFSYIDTYEPLHTAAYLLPHPFRKRLKRAHYQGWNGGGDVLRRHPPLPSSPLTSSRFARRTSRYLSPLSLSHQQRRRGRTCMVGKGGRRKGRDVARFAALPAPLVCIARTTSSVLCRPHISRRSPAVFYRHRNHTSKQQHRKRPSSIIPCVPMPVSFSSLSRRQHAPAGTAAARGDVVTRFAYLSLRFTVWRIINLTILVSFLPNVLAAGVGLPGSLSMGGGPHPTLPPPRPASLGTTRQTWTWTVQYKTITPQSHAFYLLLSTHAIQAFTCPCLSLGREGRKEDGCGRCGISRAPASTLHRACLTDAYTRICHQFYHPSHGERGAAFIATPRACRAATRTWLFMRL